MHTCLEQDEVFIKLMLIPPSDKHEGWYLRADLSTIVVISINFCPWCGEKLGS